jgi:hypothetical protein
MCKRYAWQAARIDTNWQKGNARLQMKGVEHDEWRLETLRLTPTRRHETDLIDPRRHGSRGGIDFQNIKYNLPQPDIFFNTTPHAFISHHRQALLHIVSR